MSHAAPREREPVTKLPTGVGDIREFSIDQDGMRMGRPFRHVTGVLAGTPMHVSPADIERIWFQFEAESSRELARLGDDN